MHALASLVTDVEFALEDDFHLVVGISVDKRRAFLESVDATADRLLRVDLFAACHVAKVGVLVGDERRLELGLDLGEVRESRSRAHLRSPSVERTQSQSCPSSCGLQEAHSP
jgi:hypothetical protein